MPQIIKFKIGDYRDELKVAAHGLYGSGRLGMKQANTEVYLLESVGGNNVDQEIATDTRGRILGQKHYELTNHLGNVITTVSDRKIAIFDCNPGPCPNIISWYEADVLSANDYYPFGMVMPDRSFNSSEYRYGMNGMERDNEVKGSGNSYTTFFRQYDPRLGRWLSLDPKASNDPGISPYVQTFNNPVVFVDPNGDWPTWGEIWNATLDGVQLTLDVVGMAPAVGELADLANAAIYTARGRHVDAAISMSGAVPFIGWWATGPRLSRKIGGGIKEILGWLGLGKKGGVSSEGVYMKTDDQIPIFSPNPDYKQPKQKKRRKRQKKSTNASEPSAEQDFPDRMEEMPYRSQNPATQGKNKPKLGSLEVTAKDPTQSELRAAKHMERKGNDVVLRDPIDGGAKGRTSDLLVNGVPYDVYTPKTGNANRIVSALRSKNSQANGIVLDLSHSSVELEDLGNVLERVRKAGGTNIKEIVIIGK